MTSCILGENGGTVEQQWENFVTLRWNLYAHTSLRVLSRAATVVGPCIKHILSLMFEFVKPVKDTILTMFKDAYENILHMTMKMYFVLFEKVKH